MTHYRSGMLAVLLALGTHDARASEFQGIERQMFDLYYAAEVANYCSALDAQAIAGFKARALTLERRLGKQSRKRRDHIRGKAWQAAHAQWQNHGLGGFKGWCRNEGAAAAHWLGQGSPALDVGSSDTSK